MVRKIDDALNLAAPFAVISFDRVDSGHDFKLSSLRQTAEHLSHAPGGADYRDFHFFFPVLK